MGPSNFNMKWFKNAVPISACDIERSHKNYNMHANWFFHAIWGVFKGFWPEHVRERIIFVEDFERDVLCDIDAD